MVGRHKARNCDQHGKGILKTMPGDAFRGGRRDQDGTGAHRHHHTLIGVGYVGIKDDMSRFRRACLVIEWGQTVARARQHQRGFAVIHPRAIANGNRAMMVRLGRGVRSIRMSRVCSLTTVGGALIFCSGDRGGQGAMPRAGMRQDRLSSHRDGR